MRTPLVAKTISVAKSRVRLGVVADTHSKPHPEAASLLRELAPDHILHAGDIGDLSVLDDLSAIASVTAVRGNIDETSYLPDAIALRVEGGVGGETFVLAIYLTHIAVNGPRLRADVARMAQKTDSSLVVCGHSHVPFIGRDRGIAMFNPGSIGPRRFQLPIVLGVLYVCATGIQIEHISCETRERWVPTPKRFG
ncbi:metallophosphoesterase family protein [soil metagenome]